MATITNWTQVTAHADWDKRYGHQALVYKNKMWILGGHDGVNYLNDVWYSSDGVTWTRAIANAVWGKRYGHQALVYKSKMWIIGGADDVNYLNDVWYSSDGITWTRATSSAAWDARYSFGSVAYGGEMWIFGGRTNRNYFSDTWYSFDGITWKKHQSNAAWGKRYSFGSVVHDNKMWVLGGFKPAADDDDDIQGDVWYSTNGFLYKQSTKLALKYRAFFDVVSYDKEMWMFGGYTGAGLSNDIIHSADGVTWKKSNVNVMPSIRKECQMLVFENKIWLLGGYDTAGSNSYFNDVWHSVSTDAGSVDEVVDKGDSIKNTVLGSYWQMSYVISNFSVGSIPCSSDTHKPTYEYEYTVKDFDMNKVHEMELNIEYYGGVTSGFLVIDHDVIVTEGMVLLLTRYGRKGAMFIVAAVNSDDDNIVQAVELRGCREEFGDEGFFTYLDTHNKGRSDEYKRWRLEFYKTFEFGGRVKVEWFDTTRVTYVPIKDRLPGHDGSVFYRQRSISEMCDILAQSTSLSPNENYDNILHSQSPWYFSGDRKLVVDTEVRVTSLVDGVNCVIDKNILHNSENVINKIFLYENNNDEATSIEAAGIAGKSFAGEQVTSVKVQTNPASGKVDHFLDKYLVKTILTNSIPNFTIVASGIVLDDLVPFGCTISGIPKFNTYGTDMQEFLTVPCKPNRNVSDPVGTINQVVLNNVGTSFFNNFEILMKNKGTRVVGFNGGYTMGWGLKDIDEVIKGDDDKSGYIFEGKHFYSGFETIKKSFNPELYTLLKKHEDDDVKLYIDKHSPYGVFKDNIVSYKIQYDYETLPFGYYSIVGLGQHTIKYAKHYYPVTNINAVWNGQDFIADVEIKRTPNIASSINENTQVWNIPASRLKLLEEQAKNQEIQRFSRNNKNNIMKWLSEGGGDFYASRGPNRGSGKFLGGLRTDSGGSYLGLGLDEKPVATYRGKEWKIPGATKTEGDNWQEFLEMIDRNRKESEKIRRTTGVVRTIGVPPYDHARAVEIDRLERSAVNKSVTAQFKEALKQHAEDWEDAEVDRQRAAQQRNADEWNNKWKALGGGDSNPTIWQRIKRAPGKLLRNFLYPNRLFKKNNPFLYPGLGNMLAKKNPTHKPDYKLYRKDTEEWAEKDKEIKNRVYPTNPELGTMDHNLDATETIQERIKRRYNESQKEIKESGLNWFQRGILGKNFRPKVTDPNLQDDDEYGRRIEADDDVVQDDPEQVASDAKEFSLRYKMDFNTRTLTHMTPGQRRHYDRMRIKENASTKLDKASKKRRQKESGLNWFQLHIIPRFLLPKDKRTY